jgi:hypothetical protein
MTWSSDLRASAVARVSLLRLDHRHRVQVVNGSARSVVNASASIVAHGGCPAERVN